MVIKTKKDITDQVNRLKEAGYIVKIMQTNKRLPKTMVGFCDYFCIRKEPAKILWFESKLISTKDKASNKQSEMMGVFKFFSKLFPKFIRCEYLNEYNTVKIINELMEE